MAFKERKLFTYVEVDDSTPIQKLSIMDQIRVLIQRFTYDPASELKTEDAISIHELQLRADLLDFIQKATLPIKKGIHQSVTVEIPNEFDPVLNDVLESKQVSTYYNVTIRRPQIEYDIAFKFNVVLEVKRQ